MTKALSIVSGTYNRLPHLQKMIESARASIGSQLSYEFVLVDGGSIDGTIEWSKTQPDIKLIEHGQLLGAVKAFNDGAFAADADYVIMGNDDIEFVGDSIFQAWLFMQLHPNCGVGCFYQNRNDRSWHVEKMPVVLNNKQSMAYYGQVCIVPKWLGDRVSWWCNFEEYHAKSVEYKDTHIKPLKIYAGDNELSSQVYQLGYQVLPIGTEQRPLARIIDNTVIDELRKWNNIDGATDPRAVRGHHPDSWSWGRKWQNRGTQLVGAIIRETPQVENPMEYKPRILYLPIYEPGWTIQKEQKRGLREALARVGFVSEYDYMEVGSKKKVLSDLANLLSTIKPTLVLTQLHNADIITGKDIGNLRRFSQRAKFVNWNGDYWPEQCLREDGLELARAFDLVTHVNRSVIEKYQAMGINAQYWQIGYEPDGRVDYPTEYNDIVFLASGYSESRQKLGAWLRGLKGVTFSLYGNGWPEGWSKGQNLYNFQEAASIYKGAKFSIGDSQWPDSGFVSNRVMQALAAGGSVLCHQWFRGMETLGLRDAENCLVWRNLDDLERKMRHYLSNEPERVRIAQNGEKLALERHSFDVRVAELFEMMSDKAEEESWRW